MNSTILKTTLIAIGLMFSISAANAQYFRVGDRAYNIDRDSVLVTIIGIEASGSYILRYEEGPLTGQRGGGWGAQSLAQLYGCSYNVCVGDRGYHIDRSWALVRVRGIQFDGRLVLEYGDGPLAGQRGGNWNATVVARNSGCGRYYCVGQTVLNVDRSYVRVNIVGVQTDGRYVIEYMEGPLSGQRGGNWADHSLAYGGK